MLTKQPAEWTLDAIERNLAAHTFMVQTLQSLILTAIIRPELVRKRPKLWSTARDLIAGIDAGTLPDPSNTVRIARKYVENKPKPERGK